MISAFRVAENQSQLYGYRAVASAEKAGYIVSLLEAAAPKPRYSEWHPLIAAQFRHALPSPPGIQARFRPPFFNRNVLYCSKELMTALYEHAYHFLRQRVHLEGSREPGQRAAFSLALDPAAVTDIHGHPDIAAIMARDDYSASHEFIKANPQIKVVGYPSCRAPGHGPSYAALEIAALGKDIGDERTLSFYFDQADQSIYWTDIGLKIFWKDVS